MACPRGFGKTSLAETAALWSIIYGHRQFVCLIGASEESSSEMLDSMKAEFENNDRLDEDFPEVCYPIRCLDGITLIAKGQTYKGKRTQINWTQKTIVLPTIKGSKASGVIVKTTGITGRIRGLKHKKSDGSSVRPELVIVDDPQTDESARSPSQCATREAILAGAVLGLAAPNTKISGIMPCTVIKQGDMADRILDRDIHPDWQGERTRLIYEWPKNESLWVKYGEIREEDLKSGGDGSKATEFYKENREEMDEGAVVAWDHRFNEDEISAVQNAWNLRLRDEDAFFAEYQNDPVAQRDEVDQVADSEIAARVIDLKEREIPLECERITCFVDVQATLLYYTVVAWGQNFTGHLVEFGAYPDQGRTYFTLRETKKTFATVTPNAGFEGQLTAALESLVNRLMTGEYKRSDGASMQIEILMIDANYGQSTDTVYRFIRQSPHRAKLFPSHGRYVGASSQPFSDYKRKTGERVGLNWRVPAIRGKRSIRHVLYDTNFWKSFLMSRLKTAKGDTGALTFFKVNRQRLQMMSDQIRAEYSVRTTGRGREVDEWKTRPDRPDNHFLDCLVGCCVCASMLGCDLMTPRRSINDRVVRKKKRNNVEYM